LATGWMRRASCRSQPSQKWPQLASSCWKMVIATRLSGSTHQFSALRPTSDKGFYFHHSRNWNG
jgi:hypothetical protein